MGLALIILSLGVVVFTKALYRGVKGGNATPLGIALSLRRFVTAFLTGTATIRDRITSHFDNLRIPVPAPIEICTESHIQVITRMYLR